MKYFLLFVGISVVALTSMTCHAPTEPSSSGADTTSNDWTFTETMLGGASSSELLDVSIVTDTLAYAVGNIYVSDSTGHINPTSYGAAIWNGRSWSLRRVYARNQSGYQENIRPILGVAAYSRSEIWLSDGNAFVWNGNDSELTAYWIGGYPGNPSPLLGPGQYVARLWGTSDQNLYGAGNGGARSLRRKLMARTFQWHYSKHTGHLRIWRHGSRGRFNSRRKPRQSNTSNQRYNCNATFHRWNSMAPEQRLVRTGALLRSWPGYLRENISFPKYMAGGQR